MAITEGSDPECLCAADSPPTRRGISDVSELVVGYGLILAVLWTPRPLQRWLVAGTVLWVALSILSSFPGWKAMGCCVSGFRTSLWVVGVALFTAISAMTLAYNLHTLHQPIGGPTHWIRTYAGYTIWALIQQFLLQGYFLVRLLRVMPNETLAAFTGATIFAVAHLPNPILAPATLLWGLIACLIFVRCRNIFSLGIAHAILGICIAVTFPASTLHNMRVGLGYLTYRAPHDLHLSQVDHSVSTDAWVSADAPTRR